MTGLEMEVITGLGAATAVTEKGMEANMEGTMANTEAGTRAPVTEDTMGTMEGATANIAMGMEVKAAIPTTIEWLKPIPRPAFSSASVPCTIVNLQ